MFQNSDVRRKGRGVFLIFLRYFLRTSKQRRYPVLMKVGHLAFTAHTSSTTTLIWGLSSVCDGIQPSLSKSRINQVVVYHVF